MAAERPHVRIDAVTITAAGLSAVLFIVTLKVVAYAHHKSALGQAILATL